MGKLAVLKFGEGKVETGLGVTLQILDALAGSQSAGQLAYSPLAEVVGALPPAPELLQYYSHWRETYRRLGIGTRLEAPKAQVTNVSMIEDCHSAAKVLSDRFNHWLRAESFRPIREKWLELLLPSEPIQVILQTDDWLLQRLPWQAWDIGDRYRHSELALSLPSYEQIPKSPTVKAKLKVLAILGNSQGIDIQADCALLKQLPDAEIQFLVEPQRQQLTEQLWAQPWDILFFAGHSSSQVSATPPPLPNASIHSPETGYIHINATDSLTIDQLRFALRSAVERGLKLAIFNSCDGLGLARNLADLQIPQMIVMREPVPDRVAQAFLKSFLSAFSQGESFYSAVRQGREQLQGLEDQFPCATWLPMICQNPAEAPPTWSGLRGLKAIAQPRRRSPRLSQVSKAAAKVAASSLLITAAITGIRYAGVLQPLELKAYDHLMSLRPAEAEDSRLLIVTINDEERQRYGGKIEKIGRVSITDRYLNQVITQLDRAQPRVIGLDLYRDFAAEPAIAQQYQQNQRLITLCKARYSGGDSITPPPDAVADRIGFSDFTVDPDYFLRRHLLAMTTAYIDPQAPCTAPDAFNLLIASRYLQLQNIPRAGTADTTLRFGRVILTPLQARTGGYQPIDNRGNQMLLNYRVSEFVDNRVSLTDVLSGSVNPLLIRDRVVLVGVTAEGDDYWQTPIDPHMPGVVAQAHMVSQILSAVLDGRSLIWVWSFPQELLWILSWALVGGWLAGSLRSLLWLSVSIALSTGVLYGICWGLLIQGGWLPLIPPILALMLTGTAVAALTRSKTQPSR